MPPTQAPPAQPPSIPPAKRAGTALVSTRRLPGPRQLMASDRGSQTMEYALILIVAATIAMLALTWAREGAIKALLDAVMGKVMALFGIGKG